MAQEKTLTSPKKAPVGAATMSLAEWAALMGVGYTKAHELAQSGQLPVPVIRVGRQYRIPSAPVYRMLGIEPEAA